MIAFDAATDGYKGTTDINALTYSHTCAAQASLYVWVGVASSRTVTVTYGGQSMSLIATESETNNDVYYLYELQTPASGANNIVITPSGTTLLIANAASYTGVAKVTKQVHTVGANGVSVTSLTNTINISDSNSWMVSACGYQRAPSASTGSVLRKNSASHNLYVFDTNGVVGAVGNRSMAYTFTAVAAQGAIAVELLPDTPGFFAMM